MSVERLQESTYEAGYDYRFGSPHLTHPKLMDELFALLRNALHETVSRGLPSRVLEVGAGDGAYTEPVLAAGFEVTATEVSISSIERLKERYSRNSRFNAVYDPAGSLEGLAAERYAIILGVSVLHHIPDYRSFVLYAVEKHLMEGGTFLSLQDPLWYPSVSKSTRFLTRFAFYSWRLTKGNYLRGLQTLSRRLRHVYDDEKPGDVVEYHVVRNGVNHHELQEVLEPHFTSVKIVTYWSSQSVWGQRIGDLLRLSNTFAIHAQGYGQT